MGTSPISVQSGLDRLTKYQDETRVLVKLRKARTVFSRKVFKRAEDEIIFDIDTGPPAKVKTTVHEVLKKWAKGRQFSSWISDRLPQHLNLPLTTYPEDYYILQALALGEGLPPLLLTLYTGDSVDEKPKIQEKEPRQELTLYTGDSADKNPTIPEKETRLEPTFYTKESLDETVKIPDKEPTRELTLYTGDSADKNPTIPEKEHRPEPTIYTDESVDDTLKIPEEEPCPELREFGVRSARLLTMTLLNFCHREFLVLPCTMSLDDKFTVEALQAEVERQLDDAREYYGGPEELGKATYEELVRAVSIAATATSVPSFLCDGGTDRKKEWLLSMDRDWDRSMRHVLHALLEATQVTVTYTPSTETKTKAAVLEAARRVSYSQKVVVVTTKQDVRRTVRCLSQSAQEEHGLDPDSFTSVAPEESVPKADCVIAIDVADVTPLQHGSLRMIVSRQLSNPERTEPAIRVLLVGRSGSGKSSTANTLLGARIFESDVSFAQVTRDNQTGTGLCQGRQIEVVDCPGIRDLTQDRGVGGNNLASRGFDVVCYVMRIERFTEEGERVFNRLLDVLGRDVLQHMIIVFTCGDQISPGEDIDSILERAPDRLKTIVREHCQKRYVLFDNTQTGNRAQLDEFFAMVQKVKENVNQNVNEGLFSCPSAAEIEINWNQAVDSDWERRMIQLNTPGEQHLR